MTKTLVRVREASFEKKWSISLPSRTLILTAIFTSTAIYSLAQKKLGIRIYQNTDFFETQYNEVFTGNVTKFQNVNFGRISLALNLKTKKGYNHEIEFLIPEISKSLDKIQFPMNYNFRKGDTFVGRASAYSLRYEVSRSITNNSGPFAFLLGVAVNPYYVHIEYEPTNETTYYSSTKLYGFAINVIPRLEYKLNDRLCLDLDVPLNVFDLHAQKVYIANPSIPLRHQSAVSFASSFFERAYTIRLGLMYRLKK